VAWNPHTPPTELDTLLDNQTQVATLAVAVAAAAVRVSKASQNSRQYNCNSSVNELEDGELKLPSA
jgi:hypothetical protein